MSEGREAYPVELPEDLLHDDTARRVLPSSLWRQQLRLHMSYLFDHFIRGRRPQPYPATYAQFRAQMKRKEAKP